MKLKIWRAMLGLAALAVSAGAVGQADAAPGCTIYEHRDYGGAGQKLRNRDILYMVDPPDYGTSDSIHRFLYMPEWNDDVSSFRVDPGCTLTLWEHVNRGGHSFRSKKSYTYVGSGWNDKASQADCVCPRPNQPNY